MLRLLQLHFGLALLLWDRLMEALHLWCFGGCFLVKVVGFTSVVTVGSLSKPCSRYDLNANTVEVSYPNNLEPRSVRICEMFG